MSETTAIVPTMCYHDVPAAIAFLGEAFGFESRLEVAGPDGNIVHAQLTVGPAMVMLSPARAADDDFGKYQRTPRELGGGTQSPYLVVTDVDAHCRRAAAAGARVVFGPKDEGHGRMYSCLDPEGHLWNFGDYDPWAPAT